MSDIIGIERPDKVAKIMGQFSVIVPKMSDLQQEKLLAFGEGLALAVDRQAAQDGKSA